MFATKEEIKTARAELISLLAEGDFSGGKDTKMRNLAITILVGGPWGGHEQTRILCEMALFDAKNV